MPKTGYKQTPQQRLAIAEGLKRAGREGRLRPKWRPPAEVASMHAVQLTKINPTEAKRLIREHCAVRGITCDQFLIERKRNHSLLRKIYLPDNPNHQA
jgi:hypothetical protein